jgi:PAS domain S-box-containing protein
MAPDTQANDKRLEEPKRVLLQDQFDQLADLAGLAYFEVDADRNVVAMSPALERLTGFSSDEVLGRSCLTAVRCSECLRGCGVFKNGEVKDARLKIYRADGSEIDILKSGRVIRDEDGNITGALEVIQPVEPTLQPRSGPPPELDAMLRGLGRTFIVADDDFKVVAHSAMLPDMLGMAADGLVGTPLKELLGEDLFGAESSVRAAVLAGEKREGFRASLQTASGKRRSVSLSIGPIEATDACMSLNAKVSVMIRADEAAPEKPAFEGIIAKSPAMQRIFRVIELLRDNDSTVLITGESGTGKELVAQALHATSHRADGPFVAVNCAAIPSELLESELFGHVRGAFTGAVRDRPGRFELADGGMLFLDEIGDLALGLQAKILRFLQEHTFERVGDTRTRKVDVRVIAATHVNLVKAVAERRFREDLYYRLRVVPIEIPPLRERRQDLELLIRHFLDKVGRERGRSLRLAPSASRALLTYPWPGNVRELENAFEYAISVCEGQTIHIGDLPLEIGRHYAGPSLEPNSEDTTSRVLIEPAPGLLQPGSEGSQAQAFGELTATEAAEAEQIRAALQNSRYNRGEAARALGMSRTTLWRKTKQYRL